MRKTDCASGMNMHFLGLGRCKPCFAAQYPAKSQGYPARSHGGPNLAFQKLRQRKRAMSGLQDSSYARDPTEEVMKTWKEIDAVCFDVDSTLCKDESIDELAAYLGVGEAVASLTAQAMGGALRFEQTLGARLELMHPSKEQIQAFLQNHPPQLSEGVPELVEKLQSQGKAVFLVSGGFRVIIDPIAKMLGLPPGHVFANTILHKEDGAYKGFDDQEFTSRSGGKCQAIMHIKSGYGYKSMAMIGDGATDLEARQPGGADIFIGYGGTVVRPTVASQADWYVYSLQPLIEAL